MANQSSSVSVIRKNEEENNECYCELFDLVNEIAKLKIEKGTLNELLIRSNLYKIGALLISLLENYTASGLSFNKIMSINNIEKALEIIYNRYSEPLDIETVSSICGYSKSNFCKTFKKVTGETFHNVLNQYRIEIACQLLKTSNLTVEEISRETGFSDIKSFCRVFRKNMDMSAGEYRKSKNMNDNNK